MQPELRTMTTRGSHVVYAKRGKERELLAITCGLGLDALVCVRSDRVTARALGRLAEEAARHDAALCRA